LDELPFPARHLLSMDKYFNIKRPAGAVRFSRHTPLITSRGCPARCIFCSIHSVWGRRFRARSPENVLEEIRQIKEEYGIKELHFWDDNLTFKKDRAKSIFGMMIEENIDVVWTTPNGIAAYAIDDELVDLMKKSGCYRVYLAVESGDEYVLHKIIRKPLKLERVKPLTKKLMDIGIEADAFFVVGFPGETKEQIRKTFKFAASVGFNNANFYIANPYVGTDLYDICEKNGYLAPTFALDRLNIANANISTPDFSAAELEKLVTSEILKYKLRQWRNPVIFYDKVVKRIFKDPRYVMNYVKRMIGRMVSKTA
ncbi:MAG: radical SAM protein, partial [Actinomycetia bacterium]|nr:radical SAM protein [Actinomycetes bacterium]